MLLLSLERYGSTLYNTCVILVMLQCTIKFRMWVVGGRSRYIHIYIVFFLFHEPACLWDSVYRKLTATQRHAYGHIMTAGSKTSGQEHAAVDANNPIVTNQTCFPPLSER